MDLVRRLVEPPNLLSLVRLPLAGLVWVRPGDAVWMLALLAAAAISDGLDGYVARHMKHRVKRYGTDDVGAWLDPVCDKIFVLSAVIAVVVAFRPPWEILALVLVRDLLTAILVVVFRVAAGPDAFHRHDFRAVHVGKATTVLQFATMLSVMFWPRAEYPLAVVTAIFGVVAVVVAVRNAQHTVHLHRQAMLRS
jgi:cardiolipin synthase (CMP-forming)